MGSMQTDLMIFVATSASFCLLAWVMLINYGLHKFRRANQRYLIFSIFTFSISAIAILYAYLMKSFTKTGFDICNTICVIFLVLGWTSICTLCFRIIQLRMKEQTIRFGTMRYIIEFLYDLPTYLLPIPYKLKSKHKSNVTLNSWKELFFTVDQDGKDTSTTFYGTIKSGISLLDDNINGNGIRRGSSILLIANRDTNYYKFIFDFVSSGLNDFTGGNGNQKCDHIFYTSFNYPIYIVFNKIIDNLRRYGNDSSVDNVDDIMKHVINNTTFFDCFTGQASYDEFGFYPCPNGLDKDNLSSCKLHSYSANASFASDLHAQLRRGLKEYFDKLKKDNQLNIKLTAFSPKEIEAYKKNAGYKMRFVFDNLTSFAYQSTFISTYGLINHLTTKERILGRTCLFILLYPYKELQDNESLITSLMDYVIRINMAEAREHNEDVYEFNITKAPTTEGQVTNSKMYYFYDENAKLVTSYDKTFPEQHAK